MVGKKNELVTVLQYGEFRPGIGATIPAYYIQLSNAQTMKVQSNYGPFYTVSAIKEFAASHSIELPEDWLTTKH